MKSLQLIIDTGSTGFIGISLTLMIGIIAMSYYATKWIAYRNTGQNKARLIKIIDKTAISQDKVLLVVQVAEKTMFIGMSGNTISKICDIDNQEEIEQLLTKKDKMPFDAILKNSIKKGFKNKQP